MFSKLAASISPSITLSISATAKAMKAKGEDVIGFGAGEPDFDTPLTIKAKAKEAIDKGFTKYTPASGSPELKAAIVKKLKDDNDLVYGQDQILVGCGAKHVIFEILFSLVDKGEEVILPAPFWVSYPEMIKLAQGVMKVLPTTEKEGFKVSPAALDKAIGPKTKLIILNSPSNPTGAVYTKDELKRLAEVIEKRGIYCLSDEIYEKLIYDGAEHVSIASFSDKLLAKTIVVNGVSKAYAMTGWRIGYAAGPKDVIKIAANFQSHSTSNPTSISQVASIEALTGPQDEVARMRDAFAKRRDFLVERVNSIDGVSCVMPQGAFYAFVNISRTGKGSLDFCQALLEKQKVAVVPGIAFGSDDFVRLSYATSMENIKNGLDRIEKFIKRLK
ncbi:pyridoxal phosphate-dependent aminotransferase [Candidatus Omnitrophota bacterium]